MGPGNKIGYKWKASIGIHMKLDMNNNQNIVRLSNQYDSLESKQKISDIRYHISYHHTQIVGLENHTEEEEISNMYVCMYTYTNR